MLPNPRYAFRMMRKSPGFLTLALGIGANTAIFSPGFDPSHGLTMAMSPTKYPDVGRRTRFLHDVLDRLGRRDFTRADDEKSPLVLIVSESLARRFWPNQNPLGKHVAFTRLQTPIEIVGVAADVKTRGLAAGSDTVIYGVYPQWRPAPRRSRGQSAKPCT